MSQINAAVQEVESTETIERAALISWHRTAAKHDLQHYDWRLEEVGDALCSVSASDPSILINRVLGFGAGSVPTTGQLDEIRQLYKHAGVTRFFIQVVPQLAGPDTSQLLTDCGFRRYRGWMKFKRSSTDVEPVETDLEMRQIGPGEAADFAAIAAPAFDMLDESQPVIAALADDPDCRLYMSFDGLRPAGTGLVYIKGTFAQLDWGATNPDFRCRGSQSALLNIRISDAIAAGCTTITTMTGEAVPGDLQHSYSNILKRGFEEAYLRENWIPADS